MGKKVYANKMEVVHAAGANKVVAAFPDVCMSPPTPPTGPVPVPYADTSMARDLKKGSKDVKIGGKPAALHGKSYYASSPLGNEAATKAFGGSVLTKQITGKTYFQACSMNVSFEGSKVNRHLDIATSNHGSELPGTPPSPGLESMSPGGAGEGGAETPKCPCCGEDAHPNQIGPDGGLSPVVTQDQFYADRVDRFMSRRDEMQATVDSGKLPSWANRPGTDGNPAYDGLPTKDIIRGGFDPDQWASVTSWRWTAA
ncbi:PAAR-like domain-containing protein [Pseudenhygromyxa sp. WMMC2535]|uniref:PAAR-like domain-containing protein n=1 Tax=Pseudenhygromyxa sp. WMMC2535 TaxID=2712867 RepID=UPI00155365D4